jgi:hypothetical protein
MSYVVFGLIIIGIAAAWYFLRSDFDKQKEKYKEAAHTLLETESRDAKAIKNTMRGLHLYSGRRTKEPDAEVAELIRELGKRLDRLTR